MTSPQLDPAATCGYSAGHIPSVSNAAFDSRAGLRLLPACSAKIRRTVRSNRAADPDATLEVKADLPLVKGRLYIRCHDHPRHDRDPGGTCRRSHRRRRGGPPDRRPQGANATEPAPEPDLSQCTSRIRADRRADQRGTGRAAGADSDPWAAATDRPQHASYTTESFATGPSRSPNRTAAEPVRTKPVNTSGVERISVRAVGRRVRIVGETSVATLSADGPHVLRRNGSVLEVSSDGELGASLDGFSILRGAPRNLDDFRALGSRQGAVPAGQPEHRRRRRGDRRQPEHRAGAAPRQGPGHRRRREAARRAPRSTTR